MKPTPPPLLDHIRDKVPPWVRDGGEAYLAEGVLLLKQASERGCATASGVEMFVRQAARQFEIFTGRDAPEEYMEETMRRAMAIGRR